jgi:hypothetical protein
MTEPRTAAGRALLRDTADKRLWVGPFDTVLDAIFAIEAEAEAEADALAATPPASAQRDAVVEAARHEPIVFAPATDQITMRCTCGALNTAVREGGYMAHVLDALRAAEARDE